MLSASGRYDLGGTNCANMTAARATFVRSSVGLSGSEPLASAGRIWCANSVACASVKMSSSSSSCADCSRSVAVHISSSAITG